MRENRLYGSEGGGALTRSPYPHQDAGAFKDALSMTRYWFAKWF